MSGHSTASSQSTRQAAPPQTPAPRRVFANKSNTAAKGMPPPKKAVGSGSGSGSGGNGKQLSLLGFFSKSAGPAPASSSSPAAAAPPKKTAAPATAAPSANRAPASKTLGAKGKATASTANTEALQTPPPTTDRAKASSSSGVDASSRAAAADDQERASSPPLSSPTVGRSAQPAAAALISAHKASAPAPMDVDDDDEDEEVVFFSRRRGAAKRTISYAESEDEDQGDSDAEGYKPPAQAKPSSRPAKKARAGKARVDDDDFIVADDDPLSDHASVVGVSEDENDVAEPEEEEEVAPRPKARKKASSKPAASRSQPGSSPVAINLNAFSAMSSSARPGMQKSSSLSHLTKAERRVQEEKRKKAANEEAYSFLVDLRDKDGNRPGDEDYDSRTVYIPPSAWKDFTPFETQFWTIKQNHWDTVLFFQKGKFYELYEEDAVIGHREFDLKLTDRVKMKMAGVPEHSFDIFAAKFLALGYKVGRVDQVETAVAKGMRTGEKSRGGGSEIVRRELRHVLTSGTIVDTSALPDDMSAYCIAIKESVDSDSPLAQPEFGVCTLEAATAEFSLTSFKDDASRTKFETLLRSLRLREVLYEKGKISKTTLRLLKNTVPPSCQLTQLRSGTEFLDREEALEKLRDLFGSKGTGAKEAEDEASEMAEDDEDDASKSEQLDPAVLPEAIRSMLDEENAMSALGAMLWYLTQLNLDKDLCASRNFNIFDPLRKRQCLVLDAQSLSHLNVLQNDRGDDEGTLHKLLNRCITPFGKRLFKIWLVSPLADVRAINARLDAVDDFLRDMAFEDAFSAFARKLPDIERIMPRIHAGKAKPRDFTTVLSAFSRFSRAVENLTGIAQDFETSTIRDLLSKMPNVTAKADELRSTFDVEENGSFVPRRGQHQEYDDADDNIDRIEDELKQALERHAKTLGLKVGKTIKFKDVGTKEIYQVEVPKKTVVPKGWETVSATKNETRYYPGDVRDLVQELKEGRETRLAALKDFMQLAFAAFGEDSRDYTAAIKTIAEIDCLLSLAKASYAMGEPTCRPEFIESEAAEIDFKELRHPCIANTTSADFIPNDVALGGEHDEMIILTGGNMAGKSTTARTAATAVIIAQMGCRVPAAHARLAPVDRIASRMGANDQLFKNNSTFMVEMLEASRIIAECTPRSLVIMDELGRGTSTFDGQAIAYAVLHHLVGRTRCLGFFLTHYTTLAHDFSSYPRVSNKHMEVLVDEKAREVVFTYRLVPGIAESSYGTQVAALAGVPHEICDRAEAVSKEFAESVKQQQATRSISSIPVSALSDVAYLFKLASRETAPEDDEALLLSRQLSIMKAQIATQSDAQQAAESGAAGGEQEMELDNEAEADGDNITSVIGPRPAASYAGRNKRRWQGREADSITSSAHAGHSGAHSATADSRQKRSRDNASTFSKADGTKMEQMILDFGQKTTIQCRECGMSYDRSSADDRALHQKHHERTTKGHEWSAPSLLNAAKVLDVETRMIRGHPVQVLLYNLENNTALGSKMRELLASVDEALGASPLPESTLARCKVLVAKHDGRAVGAAVIGRVRPGTARRVIAPQEPTMDAAKEAEDASVERADVGGQAVFVSGPLPDSECPPIGLHRIHVVPALRRSGLASALLDAVLAHGVYGQSARSLEDAHGGRAGVVAFSQPTQSGKSLAEAWLSRSQSGAQRLVIFEDCPAD